MDRKRVEHIPLMLSCQASGQRVTKVSLFYNKKKFGKIEKQIFLKFSTQPEKICDWLYFIIRVRQLNN